ncbi:hypothetical protein ACWGPT_18400 [Pseudorhizobium sp. NPDC055634]
MDRILADRRHLDAVYRQASVKQFFPKATVRCPDGPVFRTQLARDLACLLDVDDEVGAWSPVCFGVFLDGRLHVPDFMVDYLDGRREFLDAVEIGGDPLVTETLACMRRHHRFVPRMEIEEGHRLQNAKDLLRYSCRRTPLNDRIRLLAALDETGSLTIAETLNLFQETRPMAAISWMILHRFISADLDAAPLGPETAIRRFQR